MMRRIVSFRLLCLLTVMAPWSAFAEAPDSSSPEIFAPGVISGPAHDSAPAFTPDGNTVYFSRSSGSKSIILVSTRGSHSWSPPVIAPFSGPWNDLEPTMAPDGSCLVFVSNRPAKTGGAPIEGSYQGSKQNGGNLWLVRRQGDGWSAPERLPDTVNSSASTFAPSLAADGSVYYMHPQPDTGKFRLFRSQYRDGTWETGVPLPFSDGLVSDVDPAVAPDESFIVFSSARKPERDMDLFIAFRDHGTWQSPVWLGATVNSDGSDAEARLGPDHRTLYFSSERTVPVQLPRSLAQAAVDTERQNAWDNGNYNIWRVSLAPWLDAHR
jgi:Tol biopolymer transport system component